MILAHLTNQHSVVLISNGKRVEVPTSHEKYNDVIDAMRSGDQSELEKVMNEVVEFNSTPKIKYSMTNNSITLNVENEPTIIIGKFDIRFRKIKEALEANKMSEVLEFMKPEKAFEGTGFELKNGVVFYDNTELPSVLSSRLNDLVIRGMDFTPIMNFWKKLKSNPSFNVRKQLFAFLEKNNVPLKQDGDFVAYKKVRSDYLDIHSKSMDNSVGKTIKMERSQVDDNPNNTCSSGLHVCSFEYLAHFGNGEGDKVVLCSISPENVVSVPVDYDNAKMRVCEYTVIEEMEVVKPLNKPVYDSDTTYDDDFENDNEEEDYFDEHGYSEEDKDEVLSLYNEYSHKYSGDSLVARIGEDCTIDEETIEQILVDNGYM